MCHKIVVWMRNSNGKVYMYNEWFGTLGMVNWEDLHVQDLQRILYASQ